jgi:hypothetical protein
LRSHCFCTVGDFLQPLGFLDVTRNKSNDSTEGYNGYAKPEHAFEWLTAFIFLPHRNQPQRQQCNAEDSNEPITQGSKCKLGVHALYLVLDGFGEPSVRPCCCVLPGSWACGISVSVPHGICFMILPTIGSLVNVIVLSLALGNYTETKKEGNQSCRSNDVFHRQPPLAFGLLSQEGIEQCRCR